MPWIKISSEAHKDMKQYLVDIEGLSLGNLVEACYEFAMQNLTDFEAFALEESGDKEETDKEEEEEET
jgi:hypothetical protein